MVGGLGSSAGSRYKVTARCVPEVSITSPTDRPLFNTSSSHESEAAATANSPPPAPLPMQSHTSFTPVQYYSYPHTGNNINITTNNTTATIIPNNFINNTTTTTTSSITANTNNFTTTNTTVAPKNSTITANPFGSTNNITTQIITNNNNIKNLKNINKISQAKSITHSPTDFADTNPTLNTISPSSGATLVEEEDFNELTAVPTTTIVIATTTGAPTKPSNSKVGKHLAPLKLKQPTTPLGGTCSTIAASVRNVLQRQQASTSPTGATSAAQTKTKTRTPTTNKAAQSLLDCDQPNEHTPLVATQTATSLIQPTYTGVEASPSITTPLNGINTSTHQPNVLTTTAASTATTATAISAAPPAAATTTTYSQNSKTTRSWPVIYRNPHHYDYEALYSNAAPPKGFNQYTPLSSSFKQNCYSNQFKQSIVYSSSNEDLTTINECVADGVVAQGNGGRSSSSSLLGFGCGGGYNSSSNNNNNNPHASSSSGYHNKYGNSPQQQQQQQQQQTTCYYFSPSRHNSIYEHPSAVVANSLQFDAHHSAATTAAAAAAVESIRRSNSILLRNSSCSSKIMHHQSSGGGGNLDSPTTSLNSAMDVTSNVGASNCCSTCCMGPPPVLFLFVTLLMTTSATAMLCAAIMTDHWEHVKWDRMSLDRYSNRSHLQLEWIMEDKVAMLKPDKRADHRFRRDNLFLVPMHGGIWTLCIDLPLHEIQELRRHPKFPRSAPTCLNYLAGSTENARGEEQRNDWQHSESQTTLQPHLRMQNLSISCSLVCLIILGSAALVGAFGVCQRQISAILITGVMYLLAALFALFTLMIIHFKRQQGRPMLDSDYDGTVDGIVARPGGPAIMAKPLLGARIFLTSWSLDLGWGGVVLCAITSVLWILLSKIMRYNPFSTLMI